MTEDTEVPYSHTVGVETTEVLISVFLLLPMLKTKEMLMLISETI